MNMMFVNFAIIIFVVGHVFSYSLIKNTKQTGKVFKTIQPSGIKMCANYCYEEMRCHSFNFERKSLSCEMLSQEDSTKYVEVKGYLHGDIIQWYSDVKGNCKNHNCLNDEKCISLHSGATTCVKIGCLGIQYTYDDYSGLCYNIFEQEKTWGNASLHCEKEGGRLIVLDTKAKVDYFPPANYASSWIYIGLTDSDEEGTFRWIDGSLLANHKWTENGQPNDYDYRFPSRSADCVIVFKGQWFDNYCQSPTFYACERPDLSLN